jgi:hypothetical protein
LQTNKQSPTTFFSIHNTQNPHKSDLAGKKPRNKKTKGATENQRNARLCIAGSRKPGFLNNKSSEHTPSRKNYIGEASMEEREEGGGDIWNGELAKMN